MPPEQIELGQEQMTTLATSIAEIMMKRQDDLSKDAADKATQEAKDKADADAAAAAATKAAEKGADKSKGATPAFDMQELITGVTQAIQGANKADANKVYETLFNDKLTQATGSVPGLQEYLEGKDDFNNVRMDVLKASDDYQDRIAKLEAVTSSFKEAMAGGGGKPPVINKKAQEAAANNEAKYKEIDDKWDKGEYTNVADFTADFMGMLAEEAAGLS